MDGWLVGWTAGASDDELMAMLIMTDADDVDVKAYLYHQVVELLKRLVHFVVHVSKHFLFQFL